jgi:DNA polymerase III subunit delta'
MSWDALVGQKAAKEYLRSVLSAGRHPHACLFRGPVGVGKRTAAWIYAQVLLCHTPPSPDVPCDECKSCRLIKSRSGGICEHPDIINLLKFSGGEEGQNRAEKPVGDHEQIIRLETVQYVCEQLHRSPMAGQRRVVIIPEAQRLCRGQAEAANAFLKTLEEPPRSSYIVLTSSQPESLLETIVSRVQSVNFRRLSGEEISDGLKRLASFKPEAEREMVAALADGSLGRAIELLQGDLKKWRHAVLTALERFNPKAGPQIGLQLWALADSEGKRLFEAEKAAQKAQAQEEDEEPDDDDDGDANETEVKTESGWKRYVFRRLLEICEICFRDALICAAGGTSELLLQPDQLKLAEMLASRFGQEGCERMLAAMRESMLAVRLYVRGDVVGRALAGKLIEAQV